MILSVLQAEVTADGNGFLNIIKTYGLFNFDKRGQMRIVAIFKNMRTLLKSTATIKYIFCCHQSSKRASQET